MSEKRAIEVTVSGLVQGVGFRYATQRVGAQLGLAGWVRNQFDGTVRAFAQGSPELIARFVGFLEEGPPSARVAAVAVVDAPPDPDIDGFRVRY